jgi:L-fucose mutarotase
VLKNLSPLLVPRLLYRLAAMGHGDELAVVDRNYPAYSAGPEVVDLAGVDTTTAVQAVLSVLPLDTFVDRPLAYMEPVTGDPLLPIHREVTALATEVEGRVITAQPVPRHDFYQRARSAAVIVATTEDRPYGCFLLVKGVIA